MPLLVVGDVIRLGRKTKHPTTGGASVAEDQPSGEYFPPVAFDDEVLCAAADSSEMRLARANVPKKEVRLYARIVPNPAADDATVYYFSNGSMVNKVELYDNIGQVVLTKTDPVNTGRMPLDLRALPAGVYMVRFTADGKSLLSTKLVVAK